MTITAHRGGENLSDKTFQWICKNLSTKDKGYGFVECDADDVEDSFIPPVLAEEHDLSKERRNSLYCGEKQR